MIIDYVVAYKPVLSAIKAMYEDVIEHLMRVQRESFFLSGKLKAFASEPSTLRNYRKRADELEAKMLVIQKDNERLFYDLQKRRSEREAIEKKKTEVRVIPKRTIKKDRRNIPGLTMQKSTDPKTLNKELHKLQRQLKELYLAKQTRYVPKSMKYKLKDQLSAKVAVRDRLQEEAEDLKFLNHRYKVAIEAAKSYMKIQLPHQLIGDSIVNALRKAERQALFDKGDERTAIPDQSFEEDDPIREREAEVMLEYIEKFTELMEDNQYEEAAIHAANSPKGILRTQETMHKFKGIVEKTSAGRSPLLSFCDALLTTVPSYDAKPTKYISIIAVQVALKENRVNTISHWIGQNRLLCSEELADALYIHGKEEKNQETCLSLAQHVYTLLGLHGAVVTCMVNQGKIQQALQYANQRGNFTRDYFVRLLNTNPSQELASALVNYSITDSLVVPVGVIISVLIRKVSRNLALQILKDSLTGETTCVDVRKVRNLVFEDDFTTIGEWTDIAKVCDQNDLGDISNEIYAAITVQGAITSARQIVLVKQMSKQAAIDAVTLANHSHNDTTGGNSVSDSSFKHDYVYQ